MRSTSAATGSPARIASALATASPAWPAIAATIAVAAHSQAATPIATCGRDHAGRSAASPANAYGVAYVDGIALLQARPEPRDLLWGAGARHFSAYAACLCTREVTRRFAELTGRPAFDYPCQVELQKADRRQRDLDLFVLLNTWRVRHDLTQRVSRHDPLPADRPADAPSALWIASSFGWITMDDAAGSRRFGQLHLDYYNSSVHPQGSYSQFNAAQHDATWRSVFLTRDIYVLELFETGLWPGYFGEAAVDAISAELGP
jgi:hypothetical protein